MKVVLDTNIFVSGIFWKGDSYRILDMWRNRKFTLITSEPIIQELIEVLNDFKIKLSIDIREEWVNIIRANSIIVDPEEHFDVSIHKDDNKFIDAAIEGNADYIITQDNHLLRIKEFKGTKIIKPEEII
ncbi:MAG: putative toxin-antitoxin system toxin component, PIN family [Nanoarchaeota archaeon]